MRMPITCVEALGGGLKLKSFNSDSLSGMLHCLIELIPHSNIEIRVQTQLLRVQGALNRRGNSLMFERAPQALHQPSWSRAEISNKPKEPFHHFHIFIQSALRGAAVALALQILPRGDRVLTRCWYWG